MDPAQPVPDEAEDGHWPGFRCLACGQWAFDEAGRMGKGEWLCHQCVNASLREPSHEPYRSVKPTPTN